MYWFYILKGFEKTEGDRLETINIVTDVFLAESREIAKKMIIDKHGNLPFRKPKMYDEHTQYLWMTPSDQYWYDYHHQELSVTCIYCEQTVQIEGRKRLIQSRHGEYCSKGCKEGHLADVSAEDIWVNEDDHVGIRGKESPTGYIYKITNKKTMKSYVGQTIKPPLFRWWQHLKVDKKFEQADITDLAFEVLEIVSFHSNNLTDIRLFGNAKEKLNKREAYYIRLFNCVDEGYNIVQPKEEEVNLFTFEDMVENEEEGIN